MKKTKSPILFGLILLTFFLAGCSGVFISPPSLKKDAPAAGMGRVLIAFGDISARNILPAAAFDYYSFTFTRTEDGSSVTQERYAGQALSFDLDPGDYRLDLRAYKGALAEGKLAATGSAEFAVSGDLTTNTIILTLSGVVSEGRGNFSYALQYPANAELTAFLNSTDITLAAETGASGGRNTMAKNLDLRAGYYIFTVNVVKEDGSYTGFVDVVEVYKNALTEFGTPADPKVFVEGFVPPPADSGSGTPPPNSTALTVSAASGASLTTAASWQGKSNVQKLSPSSSYGWAAMTASLSAFSGQEVTVSLSADMWIDGADNRIVWQLNSDGYPVVAGNQSYTGNAWHTISGSLNITVSGSPLVYLCGDDSTNGLNNKTLYIANLKCTVTPVSSSGSGSGSTGLSFNEAPSLKEAYRDHFLMGNIFNPQNAIPLPWTSKYDPGARVLSMTELGRHFNILTPENDMKPDHLAPRKGVYTFEIADEMIAAAAAAGIAVHGHTLIWHSTDQNPQWIKDEAAAAREAALADMQTYIQDVVSHFRGKVVSWDIVNEVFADEINSDPTNNWAGALRSENPWFKAIGSAYIEEAYKAARAADPEALLFYNDYSLDSTWTNGANKAKAVAAMVRDINNRNPNAGGRPLIDGIGMQSHHNIDVTRAGVKTSLDLFKALNVKIAISELDVLAQTWNQYKNETAPTAAGLASQAARYGEFFTLFKSGDYQDSIVRVTIWGVSDPQSWRKTGLPLLFDADFRAKASFNSVIDASK